MNAAMVNIPSRTLSLQASGVGELGLLGKVGKVGKVGLSGPISAPISAAPTLSESGPAIGSRI